MLGKAIWRLRVQENPSAAGVPPRTPLRELTALPQTPWWGGLAVPSPRTPSPALGRSGLASSTPTPKLVPTPLIILSYYHSSRFANLTIFDICDLGQQTRGVATRWTGVHVHPTFLQDHSWDQCRSGDFSGSGGGGWLDLVLYSKVFFLWCFCSGSNVTVVYEATLLILVFF